MHIVDHAFVCDAGINQLVCDSSNNVLRAGADADDLSDTLIPGGAI